MPRCTACTHPDAEAVNAALAEGVPILRIAERFGLSRPAVTRHRDRHFGLQAMRKVFDADPTDSPATLVDRLNRLSQEAARIKERAERAGDLRLALNAVRELAGLVELTAKLRGDLPEQTIAVVNLPEWPLILGALRRYPEARLAVREALEAS